MSHKTTQLSTNQASLHYEVFGKPSAHPIVFIHGFPFHSKMWVNQIEHLQKDFNVITYDIRGCGKSTNQLENFTMETLADDLLRLIQELGGKAHVVGFSMGGYVALRAIEKKPEVFRSLVLMDTQSVADGNEGKLKRHDVMEKIRTIGVKDFAHGFLKNAMSAKNFETNPQLIDQLEGMIQGNTPGGLLSSVAAMISRTDTTESLSKINVPTLILVGEEDKITPVTIAEDLELGIKDATLQVIRSAGHMSPVENPSAVNVELHNFFTQTTSSGKTTT